MNREEIELAITQIDAAVKKDGAVVQLQQYGGGPDESKISANEAGYLRLGVEFLKAAYAKKDPNIDEGDSISVDLEYLISPDSNVGFDWFERNENLIPIKDQKEPFKSHVFRLFVISVFVVIMVLAVVGAVSLIKLL